jgi:hypothetical protein
MTTYRITAEVPTAYQLQSIRHFGMDVKKLFNGGYHASQDFDTLEEAQQFLIERAERYFEDENDLENALFDIHRHGVLGIDACTASIEAVEIEEVEVDQEEVDDEDRDEQDSIDRFEDDRQSNW